MHCGFTWLYGGYLKKGHPVGFLENEVTNAYLQNVVNWPIPACKSAESGDVDETGPLDQTGSPKESVADVVASIP